MKIYIAGRYDRHPEFRSYRARLEAIGHEVTSRWIDPTQHLAVALSDWQRATDDLEDLAGADIVLMFTGGTPGGAGRWVELGYALALGRPVWLIGTRENMFHQLPQIQFDSLEEAMHALRAARL